MISWYSFVAFIPRVITREIHVCFAGIDQWLVSHA